MVAWSVDVATGVPDICDILLSTDDESIADIGRKSGALVPWLRPSALATDEASSVDVALHAVDWYESEHGNLDGLMLLQPTSPFRTREMLEMGLELFRVHGCSVIGVSPVKAHPLWCFRIESGYMRSVLGDSDPQCREPVYAVNGAFYLIAPARLRQERSFLSGEMVPLVSARPEASIDIDTEWDWFVATAVEARRQQRESSPF